SIACNPAVRLMLPPRKVFPWKKSFSTTKVPSMNRRLPSSLAVYKLTVPVVGTLIKPVQRAATSVAPTFAYVTFADVVNEVGLIRGNRTRPVSAETVGVRYPSQAPDVGSSSTGWPPPHGNW